jgi:hypothetical protein
VNIRAASFVVSSALAMVSPTVQAQPRALSPYRQDAPPTPESTPAGAVDRLQSMWRLELGYRGSFVTDPGYNPFSSQDYFAQVSLGASRTVYARGRFSFAPGLSWDYGKSTSTARGDATSLEMHRLSLPLEGRMHFGTWGYAFLRVAPGAALENAEIDDPSAPSPLTKSRWLFSTDVSAGYAYPLLPRADAFTSTARLWLQTDIGYGVVVAQRLNLSPGSASGDQGLPSGAVDLGSLSMHGVFYRLAGAVSF